MGRGVPDFRKEGVNGAATEKCLILVEEDEKERRDKCYGSRDCEAPVVVVIPLKRRNGVVGQIPSSQLNVPILILLLLLVSWILNPTSLVLPIRYSYLDMCAPKREKYTFIILL